MKRAALIEAKLAQTAERLAGMDLPAAPAWAAAARDGAKARVAAQGLPHARDEYWKYTKPAAFTDAAPAAGATSTEAPVFKDAQRIVFTDGVFDADASDDLGDVTLLAAGAADWAQDLYGVLETAGQDPVARPLCALNTAYATDGVLIHVTKSADRPVLIQYRQTDASADVVLHHVVRVDAGASLTLLEEGCAGARSNIVLEADIADTAAFNHLRIQGREDARDITSGVFARLGRESSFKSFTLTMNGRLTRNDVVLTLTGDDAQAHVAGASLGDGTYHHDDTVFITHDAVNCESRQVFKKVLRNGATGVFQGKILVKEGAQKTDGYQISQSLLLDEDSQFLAKPELEIYADDVACSHGSTSGAIDEEGLFYLRSRGVPYKDAIDMLTLAFLAEALDEIEDEDLSEQMLDLLRDWLGQA